MDCVGCGSAVVSERSARTAQGYRRFHCRVCGKQLNERSAGSLNRTQYPTADGRFDPTFKQPLSVTDREVLHAAVAVVHKTAPADRTATAQRLLERVEHEVRPC
jgi:hypothetical protein